ncbi:hypothetical protein [Hyalangium versicolor]|uniref:hypothetical protein n=1 Tax=Hyalangium versicolor TaxID=2861190 RepID=UPI001CCA75B2|nr:hypothetical protein [Hyalangium versicolor]
MKVLIIPEDPTLDAHILQPIVEKLFEELGRKARIEVLQDPHLKGIDEALNKDMVARIVEENPMVDLFLLVVDRDCNRFENEARAASREQEHPGKLLSCVAIEEVEVWMLALHREALGERWGAIRSDCDPKERYAEPFLREQGWLSQVGKGRKRAMRGLSAQWKSLLSLCPELSALHERLRVGFTHAS